MNNGSGSVCAITAAFNDPEGLRLLLASVAGQTRPVDGFVVVDNSTGDAFREENKRITDGFAEKFPRLEYILSPENRGSAGGFKKGTGVAYANGFEWIWLLDQDGTADGRCIENLLASSQGRKMLCPKVLSAEDETTELPFRWKTNFIGGTYPVYSNGRDSGVIEMSIFATHGVIMNRAVIDEAGYYDDANFFCGWEDTDYSYRLMKNGVKIFLAPGAAVFHPDLDVKYDNKIKRNPFDRALHGLFSLSTHFLPLFLGAAPEQRLSPIMKLRLDTHISFVRKHFHGAKLFFLVAYSSFILMLWKIFGKPVLFRESLRRYAKMLGGGDG
jgi:GT2 family glycosyltransferase